MLILEIEQLKFKKLKIIIKIQNLRKRISESLLASNFVKKTKFYYEIWGKEKVEKIKKQMGLQIKELMQQQGHK